MKINLGGLWSALFPTVLSTVASQLGGVKAGDAMAQATGGTNLSETAGGAPSVQDVVDKTLAAAKPALETVVNQAVDEAANVVIAQFVPEADRAAAMQAFDAALNAAVDAKIEAWKVTVGS